MELTSCALRPLSNSWRFGFTPFGKHGFFINTRRTPLLPSTRRPFGRLWNIQALDKDLQAVFELASDTELRELSTILYGQSLLSPVFKSLRKGDGTPDWSDYEDLERDALIERLESRFLYLAANAKETLRGWRPTYRDVLLCVRTKLGVRCSTDLSTEDLESEIFLYLLEQSTKDSMQSTSKDQVLGDSDRAINFSQHAKNWPFHLSLGGGELLKILLKGGSAATISIFQKMAARRLFGRVLVESARYQVAKEALRMGGEAAALSLQTRIAALGARQGLIKVASYYSTIRTASMLLGPLLWGTLLAEVFIKSIGTDYARVIQAIYAFAQIRLLRTYGWTFEKQNVSNR